VGLNLNIMKKLIITLSLILITFVTNAQLQYENGFNDVSTADTTLNNFMLHWLRKPYRLGGMSESGIDCSQFTKRLYRDVYNKQLANVAYKQWNQTERIKKDSLVVGDLVFFRSTQSPSGWHCGAYIGNTYFVHASNKAEGVKISSLNEPRYRRSYRGAGRLK
jgi:cell wall-associated NlpC family hydrolase